LKLGEQELLESDFELNNVEIIKEAIDKSLAIANEDKWCIYII
jgi:DNA repair protein RecN (Recombination protein N)